MAFSFKDDVPVELQQHIRQGLLDLKTNCSLDGQPYIDSVEAGAQNEAKHGPRYDVRPQFCLVLVDLTPFIIVYLRVSIFVEGPRRLFCQ